MSKILNQEGRVFGCLSAAEQQELKAAKVSGAKLEQAISRGGSVLYVELPFERVQWGPMSVYRVTLPDEPVKLTCPKCGMELEDRSAFAKDRAWVCIYGCGYSQPDSEQRPKMPAPREGYHAGEWRLPVAGEMYFKHNKHELNLRGSDSWGNLGPVWIAVKDAVPAHPNDCTCPVCFLTRPDCDEPVPEKVPVVPMPEQYWRHGRNGAGFCRTFNGIITECFGNDWPQACVGRQLICSTCLETPITESEYAAAKQSAPAPVVGYTIEGVPATARECAAFIQGVQSVEEDAKPAVRTIEPLGNYPDMKQMRDKINEIVAWSRDVAKWINAQRENRMEANTRKQGQTPQGENHE